MTGQLFTDFFLTEGIRATAEWQASQADSEALAAFSDGMRQHYDALSGSADPNEAVTEQELIRPILDLLGWADYLPQQGAARNEDIPDLLLFPDADSKARAAGRSSAVARYRDALMVEERSGSGCRWTLVMRTKGLIPGRRTAGYCDTCRLPRSSRTPASGGDSSPPAACGGSTITEPVRAPPATSKPTSETCSNPNTKTACASSISCSAATPSPSGMEPSRPSWSQPLPRAAATRSRWPRTFRAWCSIVSSQAC